MQNSFLPDPDEACFCSQMLLACPSGPRIQSKAAATYHHSQSAFHILDQTDLLLQFTWPQHSFHISMKSFCFPPPLYVVSLLKKQRHHFADKGPYSQSYGFSSSPVRMWELDHKKGWVSKNWCFQIVVLEKTLESPLDCKKIKSVHPKGNQSWIFIGRTDAEAEIPKLWPPDVKNWLLWKDPDVWREWRKAKGTTEDEMVRWHHWLNEHEFE